MTLKIDMIGGNCPVQAEGTIDGVPFYFRARGEHWSMEIGGDIDEGRAAWKRREPWGEEKFAAGWMDEGEALKIIARCAEEYLKERAKSDGTSNQGNS